jgi:hypothetical protein
MPFITFIYKLAKNQRCFYGKYMTDYISDDHEGLDREIRPYVIKGINKYREKRNLQPIKKVHIGILSFVCNKIIPTYSTKKEKDCFDFYYIERDHTNNYNETIYVNGMKL